MEVEGSLLQVDQVEMRNCVDWSRGAAYVRDDTVTRSVSNI